MPFFGLSDITIKQEGTRGPLSSLFENANKKNLFRYPADVGNYDKAHYMVIHVFKQKSSKYSGVQSSGDIPTSFTNTGGKTIPSLPNIKEKFSGAINGGVDKAFNSINQALGGKLSFFKPAGSSFSSAREAQNTNNSSYIQSVEKIKRTALIDTTVQTSDSIALYMPDTVQFTYSQNYESLELGKELAGQAFATGSSLFEKMKSGEDSNLGGTIKAALAATTAKGAGALFGAEQTTKVGLFLGTGGAVVNPRMEILYTSPNFREFTFEFMFYPRDEREALEVQNIIETLRFHQAPELDDSSNGLLLIAPSEFEVEFFYAGKINPNVPQMTRCILQNISVNYAPNGWSTYEMPSELSPALGRTGMPSAIQMTLDFKETQFLTKRDFRSKTGGQRPDVEGMKKNIFANPKRP
jgi:hypothetical protein